MGLSIQLQCKVSPSRQNGAVVHPFHSRPRRPLRLRAHVGLRTALQLRASEAISPGHRSAGPDPQPANPLLR